MKQPEQKTKIVVKQLPAGGLHIYSDLEEAAIQDISGVRDAYAINNALIYADLDPRYDAEEIIAAITALAEEPPE